MSRHLKNLVGLTLVKRGSRKMTRRSYGFVVPRFYEGIAGGAETLVGELAAHVQAAGHHVEVFATCAKDNRTWENEFQPGLAVEYGLQVRRFEVDERDLDVWIPRQINISEGMNLSIDDQLAWMTESVNSRGLYTHILRRAQDFDALFFAPYLFGTTFWGAQLVRERSYLIPCLHDEHYAYTDVMQALFQNVSGCLFNAVPEQEFAERLYGGMRGGVVGKGFDTDVIGQERLSCFEGIDRPYLLYLGRKETGKNVQQLLDYFMQGKDSGCLSSELALVIAGGGSFDDILRPEAAERSDVLDIGYVSEEDKARLMQHALAFCLPSLNESFSIVIMESWLQGTPVLVHAQCPVTRHHVTASGGGLYFGTCEDFIGTVKCLEENEDLRQDFASAGRKYVEREYSWDAVVTRFERVMESLLSEDRVANDQSQGQN